MRRFCTVAVLLVLSPAVMAQGRGGGAAGIAVGGRAGGPPGRGAVLSSVFFAPANPVGFNSAGGPAANLGYPYGGVIPIYPSPFASYYGGGWYGGGYGGYGPVMEPGPNLTRFSRDYMFTEAAPAAGPRFPAYAAPIATTASGAAEVALTVPANAEVRVQGGEVAGSGESRLITAGSSGAVTVAVKWTADGKPVEQSYTVHTIPGRRSSLTVLR